MNLPRASVKYPVTTTVGVILAVLFGAISLYRIPVQMTPTVDRPVITVETEYKGAAPLEVEEEVSKPVEEKLTSVEGLNRMTSRSEEGKSPRRPRVRLGCGQGRGPPRRLGKTGTRPQLAR